MRQVQVIQDRLGIMRRNVYDAIQDELDKQSGEVMVLGESAAGWH